MAMAMTMASEDIEKRLQELEEQRRQIVSTLNHSTHVLEAIEQQITEFKRRQQVRMQQDERVDNDLLRQQQENADDSPAP